MNPPVPIDMEAVKNYASLGASNREIARMIGVTEKTVRNRCKDVLRLGRAEMRSSLRKRQFEIAMEGNPTMLIWLGKNILGQADKSEQKIDQKLIIRDRTVDSADTSTDALRKGDGVSQDGDD